MEDAFAVFLHEGGHLLVDGDKEFKRIYNSFIKKFPKNLKKDKKLREIYERIKKDYKQEDWAEETIMHYVQDQANVNLPWYKELVSKLRVWLANKLGINVGLSAHDLGRIIYHKVQRKLHVPVSSGQAKLSISKPAKAHTTMQGSEILPSFQTGLASFISWDETQPLLKSTNKVKFSLTDVMDDILQEEAVSNKGGYKFYAKLLDRIKKATEMKGPKVKEGQATSSWFSRAFSSSERTLRKHAAAYKVWLLANDEETAKFRLQRKIQGDWMDTKKVLQSRLQTAIGSSSKVYKKVLKTAGEYMVKTDATGKGFRLKVLTNEKTMPKLSAVRKKLDWKFKITSYQVLDRNNEVLGTYKSKKAALAAAHAAESAYLKQQGHSQDVIDMVRRSRELTDRAFEALIKDLKAVQADMRKHGLAEPKGKITVKDGKVKLVSLTELMREYGDLQGTYFPRDRGTRKFNLRAKKIVNGKTVERKLETFDIYAPLDETKSGLSNILKRVLNKGTPIGRRYTELEKKGWTVEIEVKPVLPSGLLNMPKLLGALDTVLNKAAQNVHSKGTKTDKEALQSIFEQLTQNISQMYAAQGSLTTRARRQEKLWAGYETNLERAMMGYSQRVAASITRKETGKKMVLAFTGRDVPYEEWAKSQANPTEEDYRDYAASKAIDPVKQKMLYEDTQTFIEHFLKPDDNISRFIGHLRTIAVLKYLSLRVSSAAVNMTNMATGVVGTMSAKTGISLLSSWNQVRKAAKSYGSYKLQGLKKSGTLKGKAGKLKPFDQEIYDYTTKMGWAEAQFNYEAAAAMSSKVGRAFNEITRLAMLAFSASESANRAMTIRANVDAILISKKKKYKSLASGLASKNPKARKEAFEAIMKEAYAISNDAHGSYGKASKPWAVQKLKALDLPYTFMKFSHNYMLNMYNIGFEEKQVKEAMYLLLAPAVLAGAGSTIAMSIFSLVMDDPEEDFYKFVEQKLGSDSFARGGLVGLAGVSFKGSLQANTPKFSKVSDLLGAPGAVMTDLINAYEHFKFDEYSKMAEDLLPSAFGNMYKGVREAEEGLSTTIYKPVFFGQEKVKLTTYEKLLRALSFAPARIQKIRDINWSEKQRRAKYTKLRSDLLRRYNAYFAQPYYKRNREDLIYLHSLRAKYNDLVNTLKDKSNIPVATNKWLATQIKRAQKAPK